MDSVKSYRFSVYERFASLAKERKISWVVIHGAEGYPCSIGRDLDCLCKTEQDAELAIECFARAANTIAATKWVVYPHPIWGKRCVAISEKYESAELHILHGLNSGPISHQVDYDWVDWAQLFPMEQQAWYTKAIVFPLLGNSPKVKKSIQEYGVTRLPKVIQNAYDDFLENGHISIKSRLHIYRTHCGGLYRMSAALAKSLKNKVLQYMIRTVPVYCFSSEFSQTQLNYAKESLQEVFLCSIDCTNLTSFEIRRLRAQQYFLYVRDKIVMPGVVDVGIRQGNELCNYIIDEFAQVAQYH